MGWTALKKPSKNFLRKLLSSKIASCFVAFVDCLLEQAETEIGKTEYDAATREIEKVSGSGNKRNVYRKCTSQ